MGAAARGVRPGQGRGWLSPRSHSRGPAPARNSRVSRAGTGCKDHRYAALEHRPPADRRSDLDGATESIQAILHVLRPGALLLRGKVEAGAVVRDLEDEVALDGAEAHARSGCLGVLLHVLECLQAAEIDCRLDVLRVTFDAIGGELHPPRLPPCLRLPGGRAPPARDS